jgi:hypothetical protein
MKVFNTIFLFTIVLAFIACKKKNKLPKSYYVICKVNGADWKAGGDNAVFDDNMNAEWRHDGKTLLLFGRQNSDKSEIDIFLSDTIAALTSRTYELNTGNGPFSGSYRNYNKSYRYKYVTDSAHKGYLTIVFDTKEKRASGTFAFTGKYENSDELINITEGYFSLPYQ